jgi:hypothetical protein
MGTSLPDTSDCSFRRRANRTPWRRRDSYLRIRWRESQAPFGKLTELETDRIAFNLLIDLSCPIFMSDVDVEALMKGREPENWQDRLIAAVVEPMYCGATLALALLDTHRAQESKNGHPRPLARVLNLGGLMVRRRIEGQLARL